MKKITKKRKKPYDSCTITTGDIGLNIQHFNKCASTDGGPLTETLDPNDMDKYKLSFEDFQLVLTRYLKYLKYNKEIEAQDVQDAICDPNIMAGVNRNRPTTLAKYWVISRLLHWTELETAIKKYLLTKFNKEELEQLLTYYKTAQANDLASFARICKANLAQAEKTTESLNINKKEEKKSGSVVKTSSKNQALNEAKRYVRRYYIRPQNVFCSNKTDVIQALIQFEDQNCSVYTLNNLGDEKDVTKLTNKDIIYYYDDGILYDKNHMKVMDYDLAIKHEEERPNVDIDQTSDAKLSQVYQDRLTGWTEVEEAFNLDFAPVNVYGEILHEGKATGGVCCICGEPIEGYGNNPEPVISAEDGARCCDACNLKFVIPARLDQWTENSDNEI